MFKTTFQRWGEKSEFVLSCCRHKDLIQVQSAPSRERGRGINYLRIQVGRRKQMFKQNKNPKSKGKWRNLSKIRNCHSFKRQLKENGDSCSPPGSTHVTKRARRLGGGRWRLCCWRGSQLACSLEVIFIMCENYRCRINIRNPIPLYKTVRERIYVYVQVMLSKNLVKKYMMKMGRFTARHPLEFLHVFCKASPLDPEMSTLCCRVERLLL